MRKGGVGSSDTAWSPMTPMEKTGRNAHAPSVGSVSRGTHGKRKAHESGFGDGSAGEPVRSDCCGGGSSTGNHRSSGTSTIDSDHLSERSGGRHNNMRVSLTGSNGRGLRAFVGGDGSGGGVNVTSSLETTLLHQTLDENVLLKQQLQELKDTIMRDNLRFEEGREALAKREESMLAQVAVERKRCVQLVVLCVLGVLMYLCVVIGCALCIRVRACVRACERMSVFACLLDGRLCEYKRCYSCVPLALVGAQCVQCVFIYVWLTVDFQHLIYESIYSHMNTRTLTCGHVYVCRAKALVYEKEAAATPIAAMATPNATSSGNQELDGGGGVGGGGGAGGGSNEPVAHHEISTSGDYIDRAISTMQKQTVLYQVKIKELKHERQAKDNMQHLYMQEQHRVKELTTIIRAKDSQLNQARSVYENMQQLLSEAQRKVKNHLKHGKYLETTILPKQETALITSKEQRDIRHAYELAAAEDDVECNLCTDVLDKGDKKQWWVMIPCCHLFCSTCAGHDKDIRMSQRKLDRCPNCNKKSERFLQAKIGGYVSDAAVTITVLDD